MLRLRMMLQRETTAREEALRIWREMKILECLGKFLLYYLFIVTFRVRLHLILELVLRLLSKDAITRRNSEAFGGIFNSFAVAPHIYFLCER